MKFFFENLSLLPETRAPKEHFKLVFGSGNSDLAKIRPLKIWTSWISPWVPPYGILPLFVSTNVELVVAFEVRPCAVFPPSVSPPSSSSLSRRLCFLKFVMNLRFQG